MLALNNELAQRYSHRQSEFIKIKTIALKALDERVTLEASLKDHTQVWGICTWVTSELLSSPVAPYIASAGV